jgi:hypothetical protein
MWLDDDDVLESEEQKLRKTRTAGGSWSQGSFDENEMTRDKLAHFSRKQACDNILLPVVFNLSHPPSLLEDWMWRRYPASVPVHQCQSIPKYSWHWRLLGLEWYCLPAYHLGTGVLYSFLPLAGRRVQKPFRPVYIWIYSYGYFITYVHAPAWTPRWQDEWTHNLNLLKLSINLLKL